MLKQHIFIKPQKTGRMLAFVFGVASLCACCCGAVLTDAAACRLPCLTMSSNDHLCRGVGPHPRHDDLPGRPGAELAPGPKCQPRNPCRTNLEKRIQKPQTPTLPQSPPIQEANTTLPHVASYPRGQHQPCPSRLLSKRQPSQLTSDTPTHHLAPVASYPRGQRPPCPTIQDARIR